MTEPLTFHPDATAAALCKLHAGRHHAEAQDLVIGLTDGQRAQLADASLDLLERVSHIVIRTVRAMGAADRDTLKWPANLGDLAYLTASILEDLLYHLGPGPDAGEAEWDRYYDDASAWAGRRAADLFEAGVWHQLVAHPGGPEQP